MSGDPNWNTVKLLLAMIGSDNSIIFTDSSDLNYPVTAGGNAKIVTRDYVFSPSSAYLDGANSYLSSNKLAVSFGSADWTMGFFIKVESPSTNAYPQLMSSSIYNANGGFLIYCDGPGTGWGGSGRLTFQANPPSSGPTLVSESPVRGQGWKYIEIACHDHHHYLSVDGSIEADAYTPSANYTGNCFLIGTAATADGAATPPYFEKMYMQYLRINHGIALHTNSFEPPAEAFPIGPQIFAGAGIAKFTDNAIASLVRIWDAESGLHIANTIPDQSTGEFSVSSTKQAVYATIIRQGYRPLTHGPITLAE